MVLPPFMNRDHFYCVNVTLFLGTRRLTLFISTHENVTLFLGTRRLTLFISARRLTPFISTRKFT